CRPEILGHSRSSTSFFIRLNSLCLYINLLIYRRPLLTLFPEDFYFWPANSEIWSRLSPLQICLLSLQSRLHELGQTQRMQAAGHRRQAQPSWNRHRVAVGSLFLGAQYLWSSVYLFATNRAAILCPSFV